MPFLKKTWEEETEEAFANPKVGDRFTEMYAFYMYVLEVGANYIKTLEVSPPCEVPKDGRIRVQSPDDFRKHFAYGSISGYWVVLLDRDNDVRGWAELAEGGFESAFVPGMGSWSAEMLDGDYDVDSGSRKAD